MEILDQSDLVPRDADGDELNYQTAYKHDRTQVAKHLNIILKERLTILYANKLCEDQYHEVSRFPSTDSTHILRCVIEPLEEEKAECEHETSRLTNIKLEDNRPVTSSLLNDYCPKCGERLK